MVDQDLRDLSRAALEAESRIQRRRRLPVFDYDPPAEGKRALAAPGTVTLYLARTGSSLLRAIAESVVRRDGKDAELAEKVVTLLTQRESMPTSVAVDTLIEEDVFADLRYGGKTIAANMFVPEDLEIVSLVFPYAGGRLAPQGFTLVEYAKEGSDLRLTGVLVRAAPPLTLTEKLATQLLPASQLETNVGSAMIGVEDDNLALTLVTLAALGVGVAFAATAELAIPAAVVGEAAGVGIGELAAAIGIGGVVDAAVAAVTANLDVTAITLTAAAYAADDFIVADAANVTDATVEAAGLAVAEADVGDVGVVGDAGAGHADVGAAGAADVGAAGAADVGAADAGDAAAADDGAEAGDAADGGDGHADDGGFAARLVELAAVEAKMSMLEVEQVLRTRGADISAVRALAQELQPGATVRAMVQARRSALRAQG
jgi:hypothetical protein